MASTATPSSPAPRRSAYPWVPIRTLDASHRRCMLKHLLALDEGDRYLRFGHVASDAQIAHYAERIDFARDAVFGVFNRRLRLIALAHVASAGPGARADRAEFGVSVLPSARGRGLGARLFERAVQHARNRGIDTLVVHALAENRPMLRIARAAGATVQRTGPESEATLKLPSRDLASRWGGLVGHRAAEVDFGMKLGTRRVLRWWQRARGEIATFASRP